MRLFSHPGGEKKEICLNEAIRDTCTVCRNQLKHIAQTDLQLTDDLPVIHADPSLINQMLLNLTVNGVHAIEDQVENGKDHVANQVSFRTWYDDDMIMS